jgi:uncharacterized BrkB/YihY/UPF0761 family membrane protein
VTADVVPWRQVLRRLPHATAQALRGTDLPLHGAALTFYAALAELPVVVVAPSLLVGVLAVTPLLDDLIGTGLARTALGTYIGLNVSWVAVSVVLAWVFVAVVPDAPPVRQAVVGAVVTAAFVAGFLQGFVLFLSLPIDLGLPFGGLVGVGAAVAVLLWMWVLHLVVLVGWVATRQAGRLHAGTHPPRDARPAGRTYDRAMTDNTQDDSQQTGEQTGLGSPEKDPKDWTTGGEPATGPQRSYLETLAREAGEEVPEDLNKAQASEMIETLQQRTGRGAS